MNWMTEWERTGDVKWRDHILADMQSILATPMSDRPVSHFSIIFGSPENLSQMEPMFDEPAFWERWVEMVELFGRDADSFQGRMGGPRMLAFVAQKKRSAELGVMAWEKLIGDALDDGVPSVSLSHSAPASETINLVNDPVFLGQSVGWQQHGPASIQWALSAITASALASEWLDDWEMTKKSP
jgi:hypothetical protein